MPVRRAFRTESLALRLSLALAIMGLVAAAAFSVWLYLAATDNLGPCRARTRLADLDNDGDLDVVLHNLREEAEFAAFGGATLWINQGKGQLLPVAQEDEALNGFAAAAGDVDADGDEDLIVFSGWTLRTLLNQGGVQEGEPGDFRQGRSLYPPKGEAEYGSVTVADVNEDGLVDAVIARCCGRLFTVDPDDDEPSFSWVWLNDGRALRALAPAGWIVPALSGLAVEGAALGDLDGDGDLDLFAAVIAPKRGRNPDLSDRVLLNDGAGVFVDPRQRLGASASHAVALGDLDGDTDLDAVVGSGRGGVSSGSTRAGLKVARPGSPLARRIESLVDQPEVSTYPTWTGTAIWTS